ncbi:MAG: hypothetical protein PHW28_11540, partial [Mesotoga sp.]|nr:hypothetical protein [Mesotoga sp.]
MARPSSVTTFDIPGVTCPEPKKAAKPTSLSAIGLLKSMAISLNNIFLYLTGQISSPAFRGHIDGWDYLHIGKSWFYSRTITYTGAASTVDLSFVPSVQLNRIEHIWNDTTTRDFSVRVISEPSSAAYIELDTMTGHTSTS